jgi:hypothetical protein
MAGTTSLRIRRDHQQTSSRHVDQLLPWNWKSDTTTRRLSNQSPSDLPHGPHHFENILRDHGDGGRDFNTMQLATVRRVTDRREPIHE